jgi:trigger factor
MQVITQPLDDTTIKLTITADPSEIEPVRQAVVKQLGASVRVQGFRPGKAPQHLIERQIDQSTYQSEVMEQLVNRLYVQAIQKEQLRPVSQPTVNISKFVPFTTLEFTADVAVVGKVTLPNLATIKVAKTKSKVVAADVDEVLANLQQRASEKQAVDRAAIETDQVTIDFKGTDAKTGDPIAGADGKDYPLVLGSNSFIPGFEAGLIGVKAGDKKDLTLTFPADYGVDDLKNRKVKFAITVSNVQQLTNPKLDDDFAAKVGPFTSLTELKDDIKKQLTAEREQQAERDYENQLLEAIAAKSKVTIPKQLVDDELDRIEDEEKRNLVYRGQTWQEHLDEEKVTAEEHREKNRDGATTRVKAGLILAQTAEDNAITVDPVELDMQIQLMKGQYTDAAMQTELDKPENRRDLSSRMLSQKTIDFLKSKVAKDATAPVKSAKTK